MTILIKNVLLDNVSTDVFIDNKLIAAVGQNLTAVADVTIDGSNKAIIPGFINGHTHAAMSLFRGFADDIPLERWLTEKIWPHEAKLTEDDVYWGTKLACLEMIKSGTTMFSDMYFFMNATARAAEEMGMRSILSVAMIDCLDSNQTEGIKKQSLERLAGTVDYGELTRVSLGPHAIYTVTAELLQWVAQLAEERDLLIHIHLAETEIEVANSVEKFGLTPVRYLHKLGLLSPRLFVAHCLWVDEEEIQLLADHGVTAIHNPASNLKLASGYQFKYEEMKRAGVKIVLGTDGCCSSNNLDMVETMKLAALLGKAWRKDPEAMKADEVYRAATLNAYDAFGINGGAIEVGKVADLCLVDLKHSVFAPNFNFISNLVYAANGSHIDTVICNGRILMQNRIVEGEDEILANASKAAYSLMER